MNALEHGRCCNLITGSFVSRNVDIPVTTRSQMTSLTERLILHYNI